MISFKTFITEAKSAPLYHGTRLYNAKGIVDGDVILAQPTHGRDTPRRKGQQPDVISLTRSLKTALDWGNGIVFELDQARLAHRYKISPIEIEYIWHRINKWGDKGEDKKYEPKSSRLYEEYVIGDIKPLSKYLTKIIVTKNTYEHMKKEAPAYNGILKHPLLYIHETKEWVNK